MGTDLVIFGTGGHAREVADAVFAAATDGADLNLLGYLDQARKVDSVDGLPVLGDEAWLAANPGVKVVVAIGSPMNRKRVVDKIVAIAGRGRFQSVVHPKATIGRNCSIGNGAMIFAGAVLTCEISVGDHAIINVGCTVSHEARLGEFATLAPQCAVCGAVSIGDGADVGAAASIIQGLSVGAWSVIGAGAVVIADIAQNTTAVGCPARVIKERQQGWHEIARQGK